ncbi:MAG TPA: hypothetical protein VFS53_02370 [Gemmatimonadota bacterium]|nr:hypothetical protein [Gemmatimonadota bacterium]
MKFLWSDAWLLQAIALASRNEPATLADLIAAADAVNHALPTSGELHGAFFRLAAGGFVEEVDDRFRLTSRVPAEIRDAMSEGGWQRGREAASALLEAEAWSPQTNVGDPRNDVTYPGLTPDRLRDAERAYRRRRGARGDRTSP